MQSLVLTSLIWCLPGFAKAHSVQSQALTGVYVSLGYNNCVLFGTISATISMLRVLGHMKYLMVTLTYSTQENGACDCTQIVS